MDERIGARMKRFELDSHDDERARESENRVGKVFDGSPVDKEEALSWTEEVKSWFGMDAKEEVRGWEMGLVGGEDE